MANPFCHVELLADDPGKEGKRLDWAIPLENLHGYSP